MRKNGVKMLLLKMKKLLKNIRVTGGRISGRQLNWTTAPF